ncbi:MAG: 3-phosphoshikimate 1-carboxyvinyltransferase [Candidatus Izimaplasma sp.]|nr:3-phosphoshikimate 1-carboxyvinyltransferase [Candidatus Izimaplasma bacterium]
MNSDKLMKFTPTFLKGEIEIPGSKSITHRILIAASLSKGISKISNLFLSDDIKATMNSLKQLGASFKVTGDTVTIKGVKSLKYSNQPLPCKESGSTLRFLIPLFSLTNKETVFEGSPHLLKRPLKPYEKIFEKNNAKFELTKKKLLIDGSIKAGNYELKGDVSSQFFSGLMFALPLLDKDSTIKCSTKIESKSYINLTINVLRQFGIRINEMSNGYYIPGNQKYTPTDYKIEGDFSQAANFLVAGTLNGAIRTTNLSHTTKQGDKEIIDILKEMNSKVTYLENGYLTATSKTTGTIIDLENCPDLGPIVSLLGSLSKGKTTIINAKRLRLKESDRIKSTVTTLKSLGANISTSNDDIIIMGQEQLEGGKTVDSYNDHRIAMMVSIASLKCKNPIYLTNYQAINKSYPTFFDDFKKCGGKVKVVGPHHD